MLILLVVKYSKKVNQFLLTTVMRDQFFFHEIKREKTFENNLSYIKRRKIMILIDDISAILFTIYLLFDQ